MRCIAHVLSLAFLIMAPLYPFARTPLSVAPSDLVQLSAVLLGMHVRNKASSGMGKGSIVSVKLARVEKIWVSCIR